MLKQYQSNTRVIWVSTRAVPKQFYSEYFCPIVGNIVDSIKPDLFTKFDYNFKPLFYQDGVILSSKTFGAYGTFHAWVAYIDELLSVARP